MRWIITCVDACKPGRPLVSDLPVQTPVPGPLSKAGSRSPNAQDCIQAFPGLHDESATLWKIDIITNNIMNGRIDTQNDLNDEIKRISTPALHQRNQFINCQLPLVIVTISKHL